MFCSPKPALPAAALSLLIWLAGCATSIDPGKVAVAPRLPDLPVDLSEPCPDPGIDQDAIVSLIEHRQALADCRRQHQNTVLFYRDAKTGLEGSRDAE